MAAVGNASYADWAWHPHPDVWLLVVALAAGYVLAIRRWAPDPGALAEPAVTRRQGWSFALGLAVLLVAADWPVHDLAERFLYSVHMLQHLLLTLVAPPLLLAGTPAWLARRLLRPRAPFVAVSWLTRPLIALAVFNGLLVLTHWPAVVDLTVRSEIAHFAIHAVLFGSAVLMWWPVLSPLPEIPRLSYPGQMLYLFLQSFVPTVPASFLTFGRAPLYHVYETFPRLWGVSALSDQRLAGLLMKLGGGAILWTVIAVAFFKWYGQEQREGWDALSFRDVEHDVRASLSKSRNRT
jgi:putative membrane protein